jgi:hypothetical protein
MVYEFSQQEENPRENYKILIQFIICKTSCSFVVGILLFKMDDKILVFVFS